MLTGRIAAALLLLGGAMPPATEPGGLRLSGDRSARLAWTSVLASDGNDWVNDLITLRDGRFLAVGFLNRVDAENAPPSDWRALAAVLEADGRVAARHEYGSGGGIDALWSGLEAPDGRLILAGFSTRIGGGGINGYALLAASDGALLREEPHGGDGYDRFTDVAPAGDGYVFLGHSQLPGDDRRRIFIVRTDGEGRKSWERIHAGEGSLAALYIEPAGDGGFIIAGGVDAGGESDMLVMKVDGEGRELWRRAVGGRGTSDVNHGLVVRPDGRIVVVGYSRSWEARDNDILAVTLSPGGEVLRREMLGGAGDDRPILPKLDPSGNVWIAGYTKSAGAGGWDVIVTRLDPSGSFDGAALTLGGPEDDNGTAVLPLADGSALVAGYSRNLGVGGEDAFVARITPPAWDRPHPAFARRVID